LLWVRRAESSATATLLREATPAAIGAYCRIAHVAVCRLGGFAPKVGCLHGRAQCSRGHALPIRSLSEYQHCHVPRN
jgi:hypothetical protein